MNRRQIHRYFRVLSRHFKWPCRVILTGAAMGSIYAGVRATLDVDFAVKFGKTSGSRKRIWQEFEKACERATLETGIASQYAEDIDRWSLITYLDYDRHTKSYGRFGSMKVELLDPVYWAIGKLTRYLDPDIRDLVQVFKKTRVSWQKLCPVLGKALRKSPRSTACFQFRGQVEDFFKTYGRQIWGRNFSALEAIRRFHSGAGIRVTRPASPAHQSS